MFCGGNRITAGGIHNDDTPFACRCYVNIVEAHSRPSNYLEVVGLVYDIACNFGCAPYGQSVIIVYNSLKLVMG